MGEADAARRYLELACGFDPSFLPSKKNLASAKLTQVPRWHFRMLNDKVRNQAYRRAIQKCISSKYNKVIDIGAGCGLLSLFASRSPHVQKIIAVEESKTMTKIAKSVLAENNANIEFIQGNVMDIEERLGVNVLITEIFDAAVFGERVLEILSHSWGLLMNRDSRVVPASVDIYVTGIECNQLAKRVRFTEEIPGLDMSGLCVISNESNMYTTENLNHYDISYVTETKIAGRLDFHDRTELIRINLFPNFFRPVSLKCLEDGTIHGFVVWFDLHLDIEREITISTDPRKGELTCWEQAVFYVPHSFDVKQNQNLFVRIDVVDNRLRVDHLIPEVPRCPLQCIQVPEMVVSHMNDVNFTRIIAKVVESLKVDENTCVLDMEFFPLFAFLMGKRGATCIVLGKQKACQDLFNVVAAKNNIKGLCVLGDKSSYVNMVEDNSFNVIFSIPISTDGTVLEGALCELARRSATLKADGTALPKTIQVKFEVVDSDYLHWCNVVSDENLCGYKIAKYYEEYTVYEQPSIRRNIPCTRLSDVCTADNILTSNHTSPKNLHISVPIIKDGKANAIIYWYELIFSDELRFETCDSSYFACASFLFKSPIDVKTGQTLTVQMKQHQGFITLSPLKVE